jgi:membrane protein YqaA with SNARE-associated domain
MHYAFQVSLVFSLAGNVIEFLLGRKKNYLKRKNQKEKQTHQTRMWLKNQTRYYALFLTNTGQRDSLYLSQ